MIDKPLTQLTYSDIERFVGEKWSERTTIDYKRETYGSRDDDKKELLKDISSFANTQGGDILIGINEENGLPTGIPGVDVADIESEKLRLEETIRRGLQPRVDINVQHVVTPTSTYVIVIRTQQSLLFPHRVVYHGKFGEFWARSSAGKYSMDRANASRIA
jgi:predicted HTH transcriptional regulator